MRPATAAGSLCRISPPPHLRRLSGEAHLGAVPLWRIRTDPPPATATEEDVERVRREAGRLCELIDGVLVEKAVSNKTAFVAVQLITLLNSFVSSRRLGWILGPDGFVRLFGTHLRAPDVSFIRRDQLPGFRLPDKGYADVAPALAVEVFSAGNTLREVEQKRRHFFSAGTELFWIVYADRHEVEVYTGVEMDHVVTRGELLDGGAVLPGFSVKAAEQFANVELG